MLERYVWAGTERLRCGYTTGSCAAMAAGAACEGALGGSVPARAGLVTPSGVRVDADVEQGRVLEAGASARAAVRKDGGDDADATDGLLVFAEVRLCPEGPASAPGDNDVRILGGAGVGVVTRPGLEQPPGEPAINSTPRAMICEQVRLACARHAFGGAVRVTVSVPGGAEVAARTFNPHLGIEGGISILGTTGIVEPRSVAALTRSTELEIGQLAEEGARGIVLVPGNYGRDFVAQMPELAGVPVVACSNYLGDALDACARHGLARVLLVGHVGKLAKVAAGVMNTHSRVADCRLEALCAHAACAGAPAQVARQIMACATTDAALDVLEAAGLLVPVCASLVQAAAGHVARRAVDAFETAVIMFSKERGELARSEGADALVSKLARGRLR